MSRKAKHVDSSTSSDSSEDEEEARKIREALCDQSLFKVDKTNDNKNQRVFEQGTKKGVKHSLQTEGTQKTPLKSNRVQDKNDNEDDNILKTTPEFRAYVAKQLSNMLDSILGESIMDKVWADPQSQNAQADTGIRLFSDSKILCRVGGVPQNDLKRQQQDLVRNSSAQPQHKKHKLSTSSESSEDDKISACVFSVADIQKENECLASLEKQTNKRDDGSNTLVGNVKHMVDKTSSSIVLQNGSKKKKKNKKKRKKDLESITENITCAS